MAKPTSSTLRNQDLFDTCAHTARIRLTRALEAALETLPDGASNASYFDTTEGRSPAFAQAIAQAGAWRAEIISAFDHELARMVGDRLKRAAEQPAAESAPKLQIHASELTLVEQTAADEDVAVSRMVARALEGLDDELRFGVESRLGHLVESAPLEGRTNPVGPDAVIRALRAACATATGERPVQNALCQLLQPRLAEAMGGLFEEINAYLIDEGVLPELRYVVGKMKATRRERATTNRFDLEQILAAGGSAKTQTTPGIERLEATLAGAEALAARGGPVDLAALVTSVLAGPPQAIGLGARIMSDASSALYEQAVAIPVAPSVAHALTDVQGVVARDPQGAPRAMSGAELIAPFGQVADSDKHPIDVLTSELVSAVFRFLLGNEELPSHIRNELGRLQVVAMKAALLDRSFFARREHPMRRMMTAISELAVDPEYDVREDGPFTRALHEVVDFLVVRFDRNLLLFDRVLERFTATVKKHANRTERILAELAETAIAKELADHARTDAVVQVRKRLTADIPEFVARFAVEVWAPLLAEADYRGLLEDDSYSARLEALDTLLWSVAPKSPAEVARLVATLPTLISTLRRGLRTAHLELEAEERFLAELMRHHTAIMRTGREARAERRPEPRRSPSATVALDTRTAAKPRTKSAAGEPRPIRSHNNAVNTPNASPLRRSSPPVAPKPAAPSAPDVAQPSVMLRDNGPETILAPMPTARIFQFPRVTRGEVVEFRDGARPIRRKLAWVSPQKTTYIFCSDRAGQVSLSAEELVAGIREGRIVRVGYEGSLMDRAVAAATGEPRAA